MAIKHICEDCGKQLVKHSARWCKKHGYEHRGRPSGLKYNIVVVNRGWFKKGECPESYVAMRAWWDDEENRKRISLQSKGQRRSIATEFKRGDNKGEQNNNWKGEAVGYEALHTWVRRNKPLGHKCEWCGSGVNINLANLDFQYTRDTDSWAELCVKCHKRYDYDNGWGIASRKFNRGAKV